jgi:FAD:protein FMN transferase
MENEQPVQNMTKKQMWQILAMIIVLGSLWSFWSQRRANNNIEKIDRTYPVMGTIAQVTFYGTREKCEQAADAVHDAFTEVSTVCNLYDPNSELSQLNKTAFDKAFKCSDLLWSMLQQGRRAHTLSDGAFDISARPLMLLWGFYRKRGETLPTEAETLEALAKTGLDKVIFNDQEKGVKFTVRGMSFDLGGMAKGAAVDRAADAVLKLGIRCGIINLGGNMRCLPEPPPKRSAYVIGVRDPFKKDGVCGRVEVLNKALATSGNYERYVTIKGKQYTHIMNVQTGKPVSDMFSVTVIAPTALATDIFSTAVFIKGTDFAREVVKEHPNISFLVIQPGPHDKPLITKINGKNNPVEWGEIEL